MIEVTYTCWDKLFYKGEDRFFDALKVGGPGGESCLTMQAILFGGTAHGVVNAKLQKRYV